jgi:hypothetical protein
MRNSGFVFCFAGLFLLSLLAHADGIMIQSVDFDGADLKKAVKFISDKAGSNANILIKTDLDIKEVPLLTMNFRRIPLEELIKYICMDTGLQYQKRGKNYLIGKNVDNIIKKNYTVTILPLKFKKKELIDFFDAFGISFPEGADLRYNRKRNLLLVKNTPGNQKKISSLFALHKKVDVNYRPKKKVFETITTDIESRLKKIKFDKIKFEETNMASVVEYLTTRSRKDLPPNGVNIFFCSYGMTKQPNITFVLSDANLYEVIRYVCMSAGMQFRIENYAVVITPSAVWKK